MTSSGVPDLHVLTGDRLDVGLGDGHQRVGQVPQGPSHRYLVTDLRHRPVPVRAVALAAGPQVIRGVREQEGLGVGVVAVFWVVLGLIGAASTVVWGPLLGRFRGGRSMTVLLGMAYRHQRDEDGATSEIEA